LSVNTSPNMTHASPIATQWLMEEAKVLGGVGTPQRAALIGGSGLCGTNLLVLLGSMPGFKELVVVDARPPSAATISEAAIPAECVHFVKHLLGTDSEDDLGLAISGCDCVFLMVTPHVQFAAENDFYKTNVDGVEALIRMCRKHNVPRLVYLSSIAATNHFVESVEQTESHPLPALEHYSSPYDITKRMGEELVLSANNEQFRTCALRPASILLSPYDFTMANVLGGVAGFDVVPLPAGLKSIDFIDGRDVCRALVMASQGLASNPQAVAGQAFFVTKACGSTANVADVAVMVQKQMGWMMLPVPLMLTRVAAFAAFWQYHFKKLFGLRIPGIPPHRFIAMAFSQQTFDNSKIQKALGFHPKVSILEAVSRICSIKQLERGAQSTKRSSLTQSHWRSIVALFLVLFTLRITRSGSIRR